MRSYTFWFGLLGLVFLFWAWSDSTRYGMGLSYGKGVHRLAIYNANSTVRILADDLPTFTGLPQGWGGERRAKPMVPSITYPLYQGIDPLGEDHPQLLPPPVQDTAAAFGHVRSHWGIPHWLLILLYLPAWAALLIWRTRRYRRQHHQA